MVVKVKINREHQQECHKKLLKIRILKTSFAPKLICDYQSKNVEFIGICLKQDSVSFLHKEVVNLYISYELDAWLRDLSIYFTLGNCLLEL